MDLGGQGGYELPAGVSKSFPVPDNWSAGRIWGRTGCDFSKPALEACNTGSCIGGLACTQPGLEPVTLAEFTLVPGGQDNYDLSLVDGFNLPVAIQPSAVGCPAPVCSKDINADCPADLDIQGSNGVVVACKSSCLATSSHEFCCTGAHSTPDTCSPKGNPSYEVFKRNCPDAYAYAYDEGSGCLKTCRHEGAAPDYTVVFCP